ncbi:MAG: hypothetical protein MKZ81_03575, partial [Dehalococcoidia bacterium]|nr:hypothetical protein [Dehalococcoidia bacterium]
MNEDEVKGYFNRDNPAIKTYLQQNLNYFDDFDVISEHKIKYGLKVDKVILDKNGKYLCLIECKGDVGTTDFVRGIGQITQYRAQASNELQDRMSTVHSIVLAFPDSLNTQANPVEIDKLEYPSNVHLLIVNSLNKTFKPINVSQRSKLKYFGEKLISISPFYFRDNTFAEYYIGLHTLYKRGILNSKISRNLDNEMKEYRTHNPGNARNIGITLSSLGFIDDKNKITPLGFKFLSFDYPDFVESLTYEFAYPYVNSVFNVINNNLGRIKSKEDQRVLLNQLWGLEKNQQIEFLTESNDKDKTRYIGSWNYVLSRSLQCIKFTPHKTDFEIIYN